MKNILKLLTSIAICQLAGVIGGIFTGLSLDTWYAPLKKPVFNPPDWIFGPVWITLYAMMGIAAFIVWQKGLGENGVKRALFVFVVQLALNSIWTVGFFGFHSPLAGLVIIILLWAAILWTILEFWKISILAAIILVPYLLWVSFAAVLNAAIARMNV